MFASLLLLACGQISPPLEFPGHSDAAPLQTPQVDAEGPLSPQSPVLQPTPAERSVLVGPKAVAPASATDPSENVDDASGSDAEMPATETTDPPASQSSANESAEQAHQPTSAAARWMHELLKADEQTKLEGRPVPLEQSLQHVAGNAGRRQVLLAYWQLSVALADYHWQARRAAWFDQLEADGRVEQAGLQAARLTAASRRQAARVTVVRTQDRLAQMAGLAHWDAPPLPADMPFVGRYETRYEQLAQSGVVPVELGMIHRLLPELQQLIDVLAEAADAQRQALDSVEQSHAQGTTRLSELLQTRRQLDDLVDQLLAAAEDYNQQIANYAMQVALEGTPGSTLVGMLVPRDSVPRSVRITPGQAIPGQPTSPGQVVPATALEPLRALPPQHPLDLPDPPTFREVD